MLIRLEACDLRNFTRFTIEPCAEFNIIYGANGSGKTSILEAIYLLGTGRSFRSHLIGRVIRHQAQQLAVFGVLAQDTGKQVAAGIEKQRTGGTRIKINGANVQSSAELAKVFPLQLINQDSYLLLEGGPKFRRQFLDWGVFHVEQNFFTAWKRLQQILQQRNAELRHPAVRERVKVWDKEFVKTSLELTAQRKACFAQFIPVFHQVLAGLIELPDFTIDFHPGWDEEQDLHQLLGNNFSRDLALGYTQLGPQRADLILRIGKHPVQDVLSRGEQKLLLYALHLAQGQLLRNIAGKTCTYLSDDLPAELDSSRQEKIIHALNNLNAQLFITGTDINKLGFAKFHKQMRTFRVAHSTVELV